MCLLAGSRNPVNLINYSAFGGFAERKIYRIYEFLPGGLGGLCVKFMLNFAH